jgi:hypothetical protein
MTASRHFAGLTAATVTAVTLSACGTAATPQSFGPPQPPVLVPGFAAAESYLNAHPVPQHSGMVAGIVLSDAITTGQIVSNSPLQWTQTLATAGGKVVTITCGKLGTARNCGWNDPAGIVCRGPLGALGAYEYSPASGDASRYGSVTVIKCGAVAS